MKNIFSFLLIYFFAVSVNASQVDLTKEEKIFLKSHPTIILGSDSVWAPFIMKKNDGSTTGYDADVLQLINQNTGANFQLTTGKWKDVLEQAINKDIDGLSTSAIHEERAKSFNFSDTYVSVQRLLVVSKTNPKNINSINSLDSKKIGYQDKNLFEKKLVSRYRNSIAVPLQSSEEIVKSLITGKIDAAIGTQAIIYIAEKNSLPFIKVVDFMPNSTVNLVFSIRKDYPEALSILNKGLRSIPENIKRELQHKWFFGTDRLKSSSILTEEEINYLKKKKKIKMCVLPNWLPFEQIDKEGKHKGIGADIMKIISQEINTPIELVQTKEWAKSLQNIRDRKCDILPVAMDVPSRRDSMDFTKPYVQEPFVIATKSSELFIKDAQSLKNKKIGIVKNYAFIEVLKEKVPTIEVVPVENTYEGLKKVNNGELFGYVDTMPTIGYGIQKHSMFDLKIAGKLEFYIKLSIASRNDEPMLNTIMQKALDLISEDQKRTIVGKWIEIKVSQEFNHTLLWQISGLFLIIILSILYKNISVSNLNKSLIKAKQDIENQKDKIKETNEKLNALYKLSPLGLALTDINGNYIEFNDAFERISGYTKDELKTLDYWELTPKKYEQDELKQIEMLKNTGAYGPYEKTYIQKDGTEIPISLNGILITHSDGKEYIWSIVEDITNRKRDERIIFEQSKLASMGEMIANIAHQWRQPLSVISAGATGIKVQKQYDILTDDFLDKTCDAINNNAQYLSRTIDDFKNFIKGNEEKQAFNLEDNINSLLSLLEGSIKSNNIEVILELEKNINVIGYENQLTQCLINIFNNAKDALKDSTSNNKYFFIKSYQENNKVIIELKDNAGGISHDIITKVFEPYFTTKHQSQGTGLGLHITYNLIVEGMKGGIEAKNVSYEFKGIKYDGLKIIISFPLS